VYLLLFIWKNDERVTIWIWFSHEWNTTLVPFFASTLLAGIIGTLLVRMVWRTFRQMRQLFSHKKNQQLHRDVADLKSKAEMMQTKPIEPTAVTPAKL
jgi:uncharacterized integral membrane protein